METSSGTARGQSLLGRPRQRDQSRIREGVDGTDVDFAQDVSVLAGRGLRAVEEIGIPEDRQRMGLYVKRLAESVQPLVFHLLFDGLKVRCRGRIVETRAGLRSLLRRRAGWGGKQRIDRLMSKSGDFGPGQITADRAFGKAFLIGLIDDATRTRKIGFALGEKGVERNVLLDTAAQSMADAHERRIRGMPLDFPHAVAAVPSVLLQNARLSLFQTQRELLAKFLDGRIEMRGRSPAHVPRPEQDFFGSHLLDNIWMRADKHPCAGDLP